MSPRLSTQTQVNPSEGGGDRRELYSPKDTSASVSPSGSVLEGSSVTLTCSSNANPPVQNYTWYKVNGTEMNTVGTGQNLTFSVTKPSDSGQYYCEAQNNQGKGNSTPVLLEVLYGPRNTQITVFHSGPILEGHNVTLNCSSDANPAVTRYEWLTPNRQSLGSGQSITVHSVQSNTTEQFLCEASNYLGSNTSKPLKLNVQYPPKDTSVSVSPSGPVLEGSSVTLTCSSNANPPVQNYTWYKVNGTEMNTVGTGQNLTFSVTPSDSGQYYCEAQNEHGMENSTTELLDVEFVPQISGSGSCSRTAAEISCSCESRGNPSPSMEWRVSGLRVTNSTDRVIREEQLGNTGLRSFLTMRHSQGDTPKILCHSANNLGSSSLQLLVSPPSTDQTFDFFSVGKISWLLIGAAAGACVMMALCLFLQLILKKKREKQSSGSRMKDSEELILTDGTLSQEEESIYANNGMLLTGGQAGVVAGDAGDESALHYATVDFSKLRSKGSGRSAGSVVRVSTGATDYAVIRHKSREEDGGGGGGLREKQEEVVTKAEGEGPNQHESRNSCPEPSTEAQEGQTEPQAEQEMSRERGEKRGRSLGP
ncbi:hypothetical protein AGOR_G00119520 [Albula goreensis]|uniref:Ig-like domain-containing protein n=1 Tax=Albula goreensis TaxID=1534307 RepID=A0A8T3DG87_9TELE|nr:hypothetical protein AGOR_G00119520 [Albula goreensis]